MQLFAAKPIVGITGVKAGNYRMISFSKLLETHLAGVLNGTNVFSLINPNLLKEQLARYKCSEEDCVLAFAGTAGLNIIVMADFEDKGNSIILNIYSYGINAPYFGKIIYKYSVEISVEGLSPSAQEFNYITEEHAVNFTAGLLRNYKLQKYVKMNNGQPVIEDPDNNINGNYSLYRYENGALSKEQVRIFRKTGDVTIDKNRVGAVSSGGIAVLEGDFVFISYEKKADSMLDFFYGRKRELVFNNKPMTDTTVLVFGTIPMSAIMPLMAPLGYYKSADFTGLALWAANSLPYLYLEYKGFDSRFGLSKSRDFYKDKHPDYSEKATVRYRFGMYMFFAGGMPMVIDSFAHNSLFLASSFQGVQPYLGHKQSAVYLSLISGGGGFFYKGRRLEGYSYFHLHNILIYMTIKEFTSADSSSRSRSSKREHKKKAYAYLGGLGLLKAIEITHVLFVKDDISNGKLLNAGGFEPVVYGFESGPNFGGQYVYKF